MACAQCAQSIEGVLLHYGVQYSQQARQCGVQGLLQPPTVYALAAHPASSAPAAHCAHVDDAYNRCCCLQEGERVVMVQEFADGGDLFNLLQKYGGCLSERVAVQMVLDPFLRVLQVRCTQQ